MTGSNTGHGHVFPRPDGARARCGGPGICPECSREAAVATEKELRRLRTLYAAANAECEIARKWRREVIDVMDGISPLKYRGDFFPGKNRDYTEAIAAHDAARREAGEDK